MSKGRNRNRRRSLAVVVASLGLLLGLWATQSMGDGTPSEPQEPEVNTAARPAGVSEATTTPAATSAIGTASARVYRDPRTGELSAPPATATGTMPFRLSQETALALSTSHDGLVETALPNGGVLVDLQGRFRSASFATIDAQGRLHIDRSPPSSTDEAILENGNR